VGVEAGATCVNSSDRDLVMLLEAGAVGGLSDGRLLERFCARQEAAAFEALVRRHGPMVWGVCRRVLRDHHDAEDAFQATFLVLARRADSVHPAERVGAWLYGVASRTARKAQATRAKRRRRESSASGLPDPPAGRSDPSAGLSDRLDWELNRLPEKYRLPVVLCGLEGKTHLEAADQLGWPVGTVAGRLSRAHALLAKRLGGRGGATPAAAVEALLASARGPAAALPARLIEPACRAAIPTAVGGALAAGAVSAEVLSLVKGVSQMMMLSKLKVVAAALLAVLTVAAGGTGLARWAGGGRVAGAAAAQKPQPAGAPAAEPQRVVPGSSQSYFGGGPGQPTYTRNGDIVYVTSPVGDTFSVCDLKTGRASVLRLPGTKDSPLKVSFLFPGPNRYVALHLKGENISKIYIFHLDDWKWYGEELKRPVSGEMDPRANGSVVVYVEDRYVHAFSAERRRWAVLELPEGIDPRQTVSEGFEPHTRALTVFMDSAVIERDGHVYEFTAKAGEWTHTDLRAVVDAAIAAAKDQPD